MVIQPSVVAWRVDCTHVCLPDKSTRLHYYIDERGSCSPMANLQPVNDWHFSLINGLHVSSIIKIAGVEFSISELISQSIISEESDRDELFSTCIRCYLITKVVGLALRSCERVSCCRKKTVETWVGDRSLVFTERNRKQQLICRAMLFSRFQQSTKDFSSETCCYCYLLFIKEV